MEITDRDSLMSLVNQCGLKMPKAAIDVKRNFKMSDYISALSAMGYKITINGESFDDCSDIRSYFTFLRNKRFKDETITSFANKTGLKNSTISNFESGSGSLTCSVFVAYCAALKCDVYLAQKSTCSDFLRTDFGNLLKRAREASGMEDGEIAALMKWSRFTHRRYERATFNSKLKKNIEYIGILKHVLVLDKIQYCTEEEVIKTIIDLRMSSGLSVYAMAKKLNATASSIFLVEAGKSELSIDLFLKYINYFNIKLDISMCSEQQAG